MHYLTGVYWNRGRRASCNQDSIILHQALTRRGRVLMAAVCDGMGGLQKGETASGYLAERLQEWFYGDLMRAAAGKKPYWMIRRALDRMAYHAQEQLRQYAGKEQIDLGTTMSVLVIWDHVYLIWHLGDSRIYLIRRGRRIRNGAGKGKPVRMTRDHAAARGQLTKCVGSFGYYRPDHRMGTMKAGEAFLLCSDGFTHCVTDQELADTLSGERIQDEAQVERRLREIGSACMRRGETDNMSAVYIRMEQ